jgi:D-tyrosyl-tRNA(Tyr) deacylase
MRAVCQRVSGARVRVDGSVVGEIGVGLCVLLGVSRGDDDAVAARLAAKISRLRVFGGFDRSLADTGGAALVVSQFTLYGDVRKGNRPSFTAAAAPGEAEPVYERFCQELRSLGVEVATGVFGATMSVELANDGPVTLIIDL